MPKTKVNQKTAAKRKLPAFRSAHLKRFLTGMVWPLTAFFVLTVIVVNFVLYSRSLSDPAFVGRLKMSSLSSGERYFGRLLLWYHYAQSGDWTSAAKLESGLDPADINHYKTNNHPDSIKQRLNQLMVKPDKSADDWIQLARYYISIGKIDQAKDAVTKARTLDPIRSDIEKIAQELHSSP